MVKFLDHVLDITIANHNLKMDFKNTCAVENYNNIAN